ncbi:glycoside hydrolase family protein [Arthrobacter sp. MDT1-48-3]
MGTSRLVELERLHSLELDWFYSWGASYPAAKPAPEFVPMIWGSGSVRDGSVAEVKKNIPETNATELLGFNEPDHRGQADMSVAEAVKLWPRLEESKLRLGSPAPVQALGDWLRRFMDECSAKDLRVDFVSIHSYAGPKTDGFLENVRKVHELYGKPVWITEYAVADWGASARFPSRHSEKTIMSFMEQTVAGLREMPFVERFAWKTRAQDDPVMGASALYRPDGSLTATGELYRSL